MELSGEVKGGEPRREWAVAVLLRTVVSSIMSTEHPLNEIEEDIPIVPN